MAQHVGLWQVMSKVNLRVDYLFNPVRPMDAGLKAHLRKSRPLSRTVSAAGSVLWRIILDLLIEQIHILMYVYICTLYI